MKVLVMSPGQDTGGMGIKIKQALDRHSTFIEARAVRASENYIGYPADVETYKVPRRTVQELYDRADVIHASNSCEPIRRWGHGHKKPVVVTFQGTAFRSNPSDFIREATHYRAVATCSTIDLTTLSDQVRWSPHPIDIDAMQAARASRLERPELITVHHSPTNRRVKSTAAFMEAMERLQTEDKRVRLNLVEGARHDQNIRLKAGADILYDQVILGWGTNALEAWAMGIPVIAATEFPRVRARMVEIIGESLPPYEATVDTIYDALRTLVNEPDLRAEYGRRGFEFVQRFHAQEVAVPRLEGFYQEADATFHRRAA